MTTPKTFSPIWSRRILQLAAGYNLLWGTWVILFPMASFDWLSMERPNYPQFWQCIGMIVGVYGIGYAVAATNPVRHWPIVLVGMLGKIFGPIGFAEAIIKGSLPLRFGWHIIFNDLIWWIPFVCLLKLAWKESRSQKESLS